MVTAEALARAIGKPLGYMVGLLDAMAHEGLVEEVDGRWRLTAEAERRHGRHLRDLVMS